MTAVNARVGWGFFISIIIGSVATIRGIIEFTSLETFISFPIFRWGSICVFLILGFLLTTRSLSISVRAINFATILGVLMTLLTGYGPIHLAVVAGAVLTGSLSMADIVIKHGVK